MVLVPALTQVVQAANVTIFPGTTGNAVRHAEITLGSLGYYHGALDGIYGPELGSAIRVFQYDHHLVVDGVIGEATWTALGQSLRGPVTSSPTFTAAPGSLVEGDTGSSVSNLQQLLNRQGAGLTVDGNFGPITEAAVVNFQRSHGLQTDGIVGPLTMGALEHDAPAPNSSHTITVPKTAPTETHTVQSPAAPGVLQLGSKGSAVLVLQRELTSLGFNTYGEDGVFGPDTKAALMAFQRREGLAADGVFGPISSAALIRALGSSRGTTAAASSGLALVGFARSLVGSAYHWGGNTPATGFDCSGLVQYVFGHFGIAMPRTSYAQYNVGTRISYDQLQPGDLVFFSTDGPGASHVSIYIGGGEMISADTYATGVRIDAFSSSYWLSHFVGAVRPPGV